jgi:hypothetical protein
MRATLESKLSVRIAVKCLELLEIVAHDLEELLFFRSVAPGTWHINNFEPDSSNDIIIETFTVNWCPSACCSWDNDEQVVVNLEISASWRCFRCRMVIPDNSLAGN